MSARIILDSISETGDRLTTMEVVMHRFVLAEFNTHRVFSRNSASSRAIPVEKQIERVRKGPAFPVEWPCEQPGMQGGDHLWGEPLLAAADLFYDVESYVTERVARYVSEHPDKSERLHKSLVNRLLEPFMWHTVIVSSTEWQNFFDQRCSPLAQPEIRVVAEAMRSEYENSTPTPLEWDEWHTPYIQPDEYESLDWRVRVKVSAARCARVSYLTHDGQRDHQVDLELYNRLVSAEPPHWSPLEHVARPEPMWETPGNFSGWAQLRHAR